MNEQLNWYKKKDSDISINKKYSTTRLLIKEKLILEQKSEYKLEPKLFLPPNAERKGEGGLRTKGYFKKSYDNKPLISVVTVVYNGEKHLEQTINSVLEQGYDNVEYLIIDGGSTDGTLDIIKKYEEQIDYWVSEPDTGIYNAMNKGASLCSGDYVAFLNADDWYNEDTISNVVFEISNHQQIDYLFGKVNMCKEEKISWVFLPDIESYKYKMPIPHPALFVKHEFLLTEGFDEAYRAIADYDFIIKLIKQDQTYQYIDKVLTNFRVGGVSSVSSENEHFRLAYTHFGLTIAIKKYFERTKKNHILLPQRVIKKLIRLIHNNKKAL